MPNEPAHQQKFGPPPQLCETKSVPPAKPALIFDLDGTLTDSMPGIVGCLRKALDARNLGDQGPLERFVGPPVEEWTAELLPNSSEEARVELASLLRHHGLDPANTWMIGDRIFDIQAAHANHIPCLAAAWGYGPPEECAQADAVAPTPADVLALVRPQSQRVSGLKPISIKDLSS